MIASSSASARTGGGAAPPDAWWAGVCLPVADRGSSVDDLDGISFLLSGRAGTASGLGGIEGMGRRLEGPGDMGVPLGEPARLPEGYNGEARGSRGTPVPIGGFLIDRDSVRLPAGLTVG